MLVDFFFASLYTSAAEPLGRDHLEEQKIKEATVDPDYSHPDNPWMDEVPGFIVSWNPDRPPVELHAQLAALANNPGADIGLPVRYLGHAPLVHYYWLFHSHWDSLHAYSTFAHEGTFEEGSSSSGVLGSSSAGALPCPSMRLFQDRWKSVWRYYLRIRKSSQHAQCQTCFELSQIMHGHSAGVGARYRAALALKQHYADQYADRCLYWSLRHASRLHENVLVIIIDAMDKTKFAWPRYPWHRAGKDLHFPRPRMVLTGAIAHGYCTSFYLASERVAHGADCFLEVLFRTIQQVADICKRRGTHMPEHLVIQSDNTVSQTKNTYVHIALAYLVAIEQFKRASLNYLMVGHTHEDIDQLSSTVVAVMLQKAHFQTPAEMLETLHQRMRGHLARQGEFFAQMLATVRDYSKWLRPLDRTLYNGFATRAGIEAAHSFTYKPRALVPDHSGDAGSNWDVFCVVKAYMRDVTHNQHPFVVMGPHDQDAVQGALPDTLVPLRPFSKDRVETLLALAAAICLPEYNLPQAAEALRDLIHSNAYELMDLPWLSTPRRVHIAEVDASSGPPAFPHLPRMTWPLLLRRGSKVPKRDAQVELPRQSL